MRSARQLSGLRKGSVRQAADPASGVSGQVRLGVASTSEAQKPNLTESGSLTQTPSP